MSLHKSLISSNKQDWITPPDLLNELHQEFNFDFDPCPQNPDFDGLAIEWGTINFVNPPYSKNKLWVKKGFEEYQKGKTIVFLIPARTDTSYFHDFLYGKAELRFLRGRIKFSNSKHSAPFPSMLAILRGASI